MTRTLRTIPRKEKIPAKMEMNRESPSPKTNSPPACLKGVWSSLSHFFFRKWGSAPHFPISGLVPSVVVLAVVCFGVGLGLGLNISVGLGLGWNICVGLGLGLKPPPDIEDSSTLFMKTFVMGDLIHLRNVSPPERIIFTTATT